VPACSEKVSNVPSADESFLDLPWSFACCGSQYIVSRRFIGAGVLPPPTNADPLNDDLLSLHSRLGATDLNDNEEAHTPIPDSKSASESNGSADSDIISECASQVTVVDCSPVAALTIDHLPISAVKQESDPYWEWFRALDSSELSEPSAAECLKYVKPSRRACNPLIDMNGYFNLHHDFDIGKFLWQCSGNFHLEVKMCNPPNFVPWLPNGDDDKKQGEKSVQRYLNNIIERHECIQCERVLHYPDADYVDLQPTRQQKKRLSTTLWGECGFDKLPGPKPTIPIMAAEWQAGVAIATPDHVGKEGELLISLGEGRVYGLETHRSLTNFGIKSLLPGGGSWQRRSGAKIKVTPDPLLREPFPDPVGETHRVVNGDGKAQEAVSDFWIAARCVQRWGTEVHHLQENLRLVLSCEQAWVATYEKSATLCRRELQALEALLERPKQAPGAETAEKADGEGNDMKDDDGYPAPASPDYIFQTRWKDANFDPMNSVHCRDRGDKIGHFQGQVETQRKMKNAMCLAICAPPPPYATYEQAQAAKRSGQRKRARLTLRLKPISRLLHMGLRLQLPNSGQQRQLAGPRWGC